jgi:hypothetical protein
MWKSTFINLAKVGVAGGLIAWLIHSGELDLSQLLRIVTQPSLAIAMIAYWSLGPCLMGSFRWLLFLRGAHYTVSWPDALRLQLIGFFFNSAMPGAVGGDLVKVVYVIRNNRDRGKTPAMMSVLLDRIVGLGGLFTVGLIMSLLSLDRILASTTLQSMLVLLVALNAAIALFFLAALWHYRGDDPFARLLSRPVPGLALVGKLYEAVRIYRYQRHYILLCFGLSVLIQFAALTLFYFIAVSLLADQTVYFTDIATIFPFGALTAALPIAPGGLGVGHVAFDRLFAMIGLSDGANVFNLFVLSQLALNLLGAFPYIRMKGKEPARDFHLAHDHDPTYEAPGQLKS